jgi:hypothetical protein
LLCVTFLSRAALELCCFDKPPPPNLEPMLKMGRTIYSPPLYASIGMTFAFTLTHYFTFFTS